jgi:hypothetical protein
MPRVVHFEIHAAEPQRAIQFYSSAFGWEFKSWGEPMEYWLIMTGDPSMPGINGGLMRRQGPAPADMQPVNAYVCTIEVDLLEDAVTKVASLGAVIVVPKMPIPGVGWLAYFKDTEGNIVGLHQQDPSAK